MSYGQRSGVFNACLLSLPHFSVADEEKPLRLQKRRPTFADAAFGSAGIDFERLDVVLGMQSHDVWSQGAESVIGTMNRTAAAFAVEKTKRLDVENQGALRCEGGECPAAAENDKDSKVVGAPRGVAGKFGGKWKEQVLRYKGDRDGVDAEVLSQLLANNGHETPRDALHESVGHNQQKVEDLLEKMSIQFSAVMQAVVAEGLSDFNVANAIGPYSDDLKRLEEDMVMALDANGVMSGDARELNLLLEKVS
jgi:hypothetical protein